MKKIGLVIILFCAVNFSYGQISAAENAAKKAEKKVTDGIIEKTFNGLVDKLFGSDSTATTENKSIKTDSTVTANSSPFGGLFSSKKVERKFTFNLSLDMEIHTKDDKGKGDVIPLIAHYSSDSAYIGTEMQDIFNIMDFTEMKNYAIIGGKVNILGLQSIIDKAEKKAKIEKDKEADEDAPQLTKTGKSEMIAGYKCEEYTITDEDFSGSYWITQDIGVDAAVYARTFATNPTVQYPSNMKGIVLKMILEDSKRKTTTSMITKEVIREEISYDLSKYKATDLSRLRF